MALAALFPNFPPLAIIDGDVETNPDNHEDGQLKPCDQLLPIPLQIFVGMRVFLTRNVRKNIDFVNAMDRVVHSWKSESKAVRTRISTGRLIAVWPYTDVSVNNLVYYQLRAGYACTTLKYAGSELDHVTVYLDVPLVPGAAYTATSRVQTADAFLIGGSVTAD